MINKEVIKDVLITDLERILVCSNDDVVKYCLLNNINLYEFIDNVY